MEIYKFDSIPLTNIFLTGNCFGKLRPLVRALKNNLAIKEEDNEAPNPKKVEIMEKMKEYQLRCVLGRRGRHESELGASMSSLLTSSSLISENKYRERSGKYSNSLIIFTGNCGIGCDDRDYNEVFAKLNKILEYNNTFVLFMRGNDDNPSLFDGKALNLSNIKAIPDYSVIEVGGRNILCIGGGISINRLWKKEHEKKLNEFSGDIKRTLYWENETPRFDEDAIKEVAKNVSNLHCVVSHSAPSFVVPEEKLIDDVWSDVDKTLIEDARSVRTTYDKIFFALQENNIKPVYWAYGHFANSFYIEKRSDIVFRSLPDGFTPMNMDFDLRQFLASETKTKSPRKKKRRSANDLLTDELLIAEPAVAIHEPVPIEAVADDQWGDPEIPAINNTRVVDELQDRISEIIRNGQQRGNEAIMEDANNMEVGVNNEDNNVFTVRYPIYFNPSDLVDGFTTTNIPLEHINTADETNQVIE